MDILLVTSVAYLIFILTKEKKFDSSFSRDNITHILEIQNVKITDQ